MEPREPLTWWKLVLKYCKDFLLLSPSISFSCSALIQDKLRPLTLLHSPTWKAPHETKNVARGDRSVGGLCAVWDKVKLVLAVFYCSVMQSTARYLCAELRTNTNTDKGGDPGWLTGTSSVRGVCSTLPGAAGKATCCLTAKPFFFFFPYPASKKSGFVLCPLSRPVTSWQVWVSPQAAELQGQLPFKAQDHKFQQGENFRQKYH